jgi:hypothetical protein
MVYVFFLYLSLLLHLVINDKEGGLIGVDSNSVMYVRVCVGTSVCVCVCVFVCVSCLLWFQE